MVFLAAFFTYICYSVRVFGLIHFIIYSRSYCHLCEDMLMSLRTFEQEYTFTVEVVDVDADETLAANYDELVPVLVGRKEKAEAVYLCHYFLDVTKLKDFFANA